MLPTTETEDRLLKAANYNANYALMDAAKEIDRLNAQIATDGHDACALRERVELQTKELDHMAVACQTAQVERDHLQELYEISQRALKETIAENGKLDNEVVGLTESVTKR